MNSPQKSPTNYIFAFHNSYKKCYKYTLLEKNKQRVLDGLAKRNFANAETIVDQVLTAD